MRTHAHMCVRMYVRTCNVRVMHALRTNYARTTNVRSLCVVCERTYVGYVRTAVLCIRACVYAQCVRTLRQCFFPRDIFRFARDTFWKSARDFEKMPVTKNPKFCPWKLTSCPWQKSQKNAREKRKVAVTIFANLQKCPWQFLIFARDKTKSARDKPIIFSPKF